MASRVAVKLSAAIAVTLVVELTEQILDRVGLSEETAKLPRGLIKALVAAASGLLIEDILDKTDKIASDHANAD